MEASLLFFHIFAGGSALAAGFLALYAEKGKWIHRRFGRAFAYAMMAMTVSAAIMALSYRPNRCNVVAASVTFYLVCTGLLAVIRRVQDSVVLHQALFGLGVLATLRAWQLGLMAMGQNPAVGGQNAGLQRRALANLDWLVVRDFFETETAAFWYASPEAKAGQLRAALTLSSPPPQAQGYRIWNLDPFPLAGKGQGMGVSALNRLGFILGRPIG